MSSGTRSVGAVATLLAGALVAGPGWAKPGRPAARSASVQPEVTFAGAGIGSVSVRGSEALATAFLPLPPGYAVAGGTIHLRFRHSSLLLADRSTMTLLVDDQPLASTRLTASNAEGGDLSATLPRLAGVQSGLTVSVRFSMRLTRDPCEDPRNAGLWAQVLADSGASPVLAPAGRTVSRGIANLAPAATGVPLPIVLAGQPGPGVLAAAGELAATVGRSDAQSAAEPLVQAVAAEPAHGPWAAISQGPLRPTRIGAIPPAPAANDGVLSVAQTGPPALFVGGGDPIGLGRAVKALGNATSSSLATPSVLITDSPVPSPAASVPWHAGAASFAQLGITDQIATGIGVSTVDLTIDRPPQWSITESARLELDLESNAGLSGASNLTVSLLGHDLGTHLLTPGGGPQRLIFDIPAGLLDTNLRGQALRTIPLALRFDLQVPQRACTPIDVDAARVSVLPTSSLTLPHRDSGQLDLSRWPAPLAAPSHDVQIVLPRDPAPGEVTAGLQLAASIGRWADPNAPLPGLVTTQELTNAQRTADPLVLLGDADAELGHRIWFAGSAPAPRAAQLVLAPSPWAGGQSVLAVHGPDPVSLAAAARALTSDTTLAQMTGTAMWVLPGDASYPVRPGEPVGQPPSVLAPAVHKSFWDRIPVWAIPAAVLLVALLATGGLIARRRWGWGSRT